jgi:hypothetical protein
MEITQSPTIQDSMWSQALRQKKGAMVHHRKPEYVDEELPSEYLTNPFIPYLARLRDGTQLSKPMTVFPMDSGQPHVCELSLRLLGEIDGLAVAFPVFRGN